MFQAQASPGNILELDILIKTADVQMDGWPAYEPVSIYLERPEKKRLLLLIG